VLRRDTRAESDHQEDRRKSEEQREPDAARLDEISIRYGMDITGPVPEGYL
jgi:hypothetical protein